MGVGTSYKTRRIPDPWLRTRAFPNEQATQTNNQNILNDYQDLETFPDAAEEPSGRDVSFERLFINAPIVHSRYTGEISGMVVSEIYFPSLGKLIFSFDQVFSKVPILPLIPQSKILELVE